MKIHHAAGFALGTLAILLAVLSLVVMVFASSLSGTNVTLALSTVVIGTLSIYWSTTKKHPTSVESEGV